LAVDSPSLAGVGDTSASDTVLDELVAPSPDPTPAPGQPTPAATPPSDGSKYGGRSAEELARLLDERDAREARISDDARLAAHDAQYLRTLSELTEPASKPVAPAPAVPDAVRAPVQDSPLAFDPKTVVTEEEFVKDPVGAAYKIAQAAREFDRRQDHARQAAHETRRAQRNFLEGRAKAFQETPALFNGLEHQVSDYIATSFKEGLITADQIGTSKTWQWVAQLIRSERGELDFSKYYKTSAPEPIPAGHQELPNGRQATKATTNLTPEQREMVRLWGADEAEFTKAHERRLVAEGV